MGTQINQKGIWPVKDEDDIMVRVSVTDDMALNAAFRTS